MQMQISGSNVWNTIKSIFISGSNVWNTVKFAYISDGSVWRQFYSSFLQIAQTVTISSSYNTSSLLNLTGTNYRWSPSPTTLTYYFDWSSDNANWSAMTSGSTTNPSTSTSIGTYTIANNSNYWVNGGTAYYRFRVVAQDSSGNSYTSTSTNASQYVPGQPNVSQTSVGTNSIQFYVNQSSTDYVYTNRFIIYYYDLATSTFYYGVNGGGGYTDNTNGQYFTITGLVSGRSYIIYVIPITGTTGTNMSNYTGYAGTAGALVATTQSLPAPGAISVSRTDYSYLNSYSGYGGSSSGYYFYYSSPYQYYGSSATLYSSNATSWTVYIYDGRGNYYTTITGTGNSIFVSEYWDDSVHGTFAGYYAYASNSVGTASTYFQI
jgi:hypothetical protein